MHAMKILVANLGSTSFKYRLFDMADERQLAQRRRRTDRLAGKSLLRRDRASTPGADGAGARSCRGGAAVPGAADRSARAAA